MKIHFITTIVLFELFSTSLLSNESTKVDRAIADFINNWGLIENYHKALISNRLDSDSTFVDLLKIIMATKSSMTLSQIIEHVEQTSGIHSEANWCQSLLKTDTKKFSCNHLPKIPTSDSLKNLRVTYIESFGQITIHSKIFNNNPFPIVPFRILGLSKIWNTYKYYYPYRELFSNNKKCNDLLIKYISALRNCKDFEEYHLLILQFTSEFRDSHSTATSQIINKHFGNKTIPAQVCYLNKGICVTSDYSLSSFANSKLELGDLILKVETKPVKDIFENLKKYVSYSNSVALHRDLARLALMTDKDSMKLLIKRKNKIVSIIVPTSEPDKLRAQERYEKKKSSLRYLNDSTMYINCKFVDTSDLRNALKQNRKRMWFVFDLRGPSNWIKPVIEDYFFPEKRTFANYYRPLTSLPGTFSNPKPLTIGPSKPTSLLKNPKVIILVNENTQSQGEFQTMFLQAIPSAITVGSSTAGADGNTSRFTIPGNISIRMTTLGIQYPNGIQTQHKGVHIDFYQNPSIQDYIEGIDKPLSFVIKSIERGGF